IASRVEAEWLTPTSRETRHWFDPSTGQVRAAIADRYDALVLRETAHPIDPAAAAAMLTRAWLERGATLDDQRLLSRLKFAGIPVDLERLVESAAAGWSALADVRLSAALDPAQRQALELHAPDLLRIPTGRMVPLEYGEDGSVSVSVKLQELFGLQETPRIGPRREPVLVALLAPNGRPVQVTRDLASFWSRTYPDVRRELRGRYPRHPWPEDPLHEAPTARARPRGQSVQTKPPGKKTR
ncbi:MAG: ATP-dependent helicase C-terminal domain-containing protein, partial [Vicinamibacterales bacterium]